MRFQFDGQQPYQLRAIETVADLFLGQPRMAIDYDTLALGEIFSPVANRLDVDEARLLGNLQDLSVRGTDVGSTHRRGPLSIETPWISAHAI